MRQTCVCGIAIAVALGFAAPANAHKDSDRARHAEHDKDDHGKEAGRKDSDRRAGKHKGEDKGKDSGRARHAERGKNVCPPAFPTPKNGVCYDVPRGIAGPAVCPEGFKPSPDGPPKCGGHR